MAGMAALLLFSACTPGKKQLQIEEPEKTTAPGATVNPVYIDSDISVYADMIPVQSSAISEIGYDESTETLFIRFTRKTGKGTVYAYTLFSLEDWQRFKSAESFGTYYNQNIKGKYPSRRIYEG